MTIHDQFPEVHLVWKGAISFVYEVHPRIVVKVPKAGEFEREQFQEELKIYKTFLQLPPCPSIVQCFFYADNGLFLEYMRVPSSRIQSNHARDQQTMVVTKMNDLAQAVTFLESLNLAHGDLRPENILLDRNRLKLSDFDCTAEIGTDFEACMAPYGRILSNSEPAEGQCRASGLLGPRTEQFALGSLYYLRNYGVEVYGDRCLTEDPKEHGPKVVELLQNMDFPKLNSDPLIDEIINNIEMLLSGSPNPKDIDAKTVPIPRWALVMGRITRGFWRMIWYWWAIALYCIGKPTSAEVSDDDELCGHGRGVHQDNLTEDLVWKRALCQNLQYRGLLQLLSSGDPEHLGFRLEWYRHTVCGGK
ncbi:protein kinase [Aspergillus ambiguus]|uniref:protein kinase n=1 Tax=Aspergillus ambiguus TaxID=176160 RepID=UPI003CCDC58D